MSSFMEEEKRKLEMEFCDFLIQRIKHAGGSLLFHHLSGLLQQARFEIREVFGTTKSELMKFLKTHTKNFHIDSVGMVTIIASSISDDNSYDDIDGTESKASLKKEIKSGAGVVIKLHPEFGIIKAVKPLETEVHFKSEAFSKNKDSLLTDSCLEIESEVYFNAVYGHDDYDIKFRATKVWLKLDSNVSVDEVNENQRAVCNNLQGKGIIKRVSINQGVILVTGKEKEVVIFNKNSVIDCEVKLTDFFKVGDHVEFSARSSKRDSNDRWEATVVRKLSKDNVQSTSQTKVAIAVQNRIENKQGKIFPHSHGAVIKFGKEYTELVDGDSSKYFLYGAEVTDIAFEFSHEDDVWFDAVKIKSAPGWKAVLVWVGDKPEYVDNKIFADEEMHEFSDKNSVPFKNNSAIGFKSKTMKSQNDVSVTQQIQNKSKVVDHAVNRKVSQPDFECDKQNSRSSGSFQSFSVGNRKRGIKTKRDSLLNKNEGNQHKANVEKEVMHKPKNSAVNKLTYTRCHLETEMNTSKHSDDDYNDKDDISDVSDENFPDNEVLFHKDENSLKDKYDKSSASTSKYNFADSDEIDIDNTCNEIKFYKSTVKGTASIKKFNDIDGEIINLYCKAAIVKNSQLQKDVDFVLNVFYVNGKSVEEQQVIDLKEIIKVGDHVNFNCFEIVDDFGDIHQKVTMAWKGSKPNVYEMTPQEFIDEHELSVTLSDVFLQDQRIASPNSPADMPNSQETAVNECDPAVFSSDSSLEDISDSKMLQQLKYAEIQKQENCEEDLLLDAHNWLSDMIIHRLKSKGVISADLQVDFSGVLTEIIALIHKHGTLDRCKNDTVNEEVNRVCFTCSEKKSSLFTVKNKSEKHAAVQTIITGGIVAQNRDFTEKLKLSFSEIS